MAGVNGCGSLLLRARTQRRWLMTGMRRSALKETLLRALRTQKHMQMQEGSTQPPSTICNSFSIDPLVGQGQRWLRLTRSDPRLLEHIQIDATVFDGSAPPTRSGYISDHSNRRLHVTLAVEVSKPNSPSDALVMQFLCSAWPDAMDVDRVFAAPPGIHAINPYLGPHFKNLDDEMQKAVHDYLEERGINDDLAAFLHKYIPHKDRTEHIRCLTNLETYLNK